MERIARLRRRAQRWVGRRVDLELRNGRDFEGVIVSAGRNSLVLRRRVRGRIVERRFSYRNISELELDRD